MKIWCLLPDQESHVTPIEAAAGAKAQFIFDDICAPKTMLKAKPDLALCVNDYPYNITQCLDAARVNHIPTLVLQDGILEWRCQYENPLFGAGGGAPQHQPVLADKIACIGHQSARQIAAWNNASKVEITGMPRLDFLFSRSFSTPAKPGKTLLVMTAKNPGFTEEQRRVTLRSLVDMKEYLASRKDLTVLWRVSKGVAMELGVENQLQQISGLELAGVLDRADAVVTTPSTALLEAMIAGRPIAILDYHNVPRFVPSAWTISAQTHIEKVVNELLNPPATKMDFQRNCLTDSLQCNGNSAKQVFELIKKMIVSSTLPSHGNMNLGSHEDTKTRREEKKTTTSFPLRAFVPSCEFSLSSLYSNSVFQETNVEQLQARLARAENENRRLKNQIRITSWFKNLWKRKHHD